MKPISDARTCKDRRTYLRGRMHVLAWTDAVHCVDGCSALPLRWAKGASKSPVLFWIRERRAFSDILQESSKNPGLIPRILERTTRSCEYLQHFRRSPGIRGLLMAYVIKAIIITFFIPMIVISSTSMHRLRATMPCFLNAVDYCACK